jgi:hypothetical protein
MDPQAFITDLKRRMTDGLDRLSAALADGSAGGVKVTTRHGEPWITVPKLEKLDEPTGLQALKDEVVGRWGVIDLLDVLKNADFDTGFTDEFSSVAAYERIDRATLQRRLLLALFALGTNMGIRAIVATGEHGETEAALRHVRRHFITVDNLRAAVTKLVNTTFAARGTAWWGQGTSCASDSKKFGSWSSNFMTEHHARYGGNGVMIYWHVERKNICIYSQLKSCSSSEVAAMIEGLLRHCKDAEIESNYVDTHGASVVGLAFTELLNFRLLPRLKNIGSIRLYRPDDDPPGWPALGGSLTRAIKWDLIAQQYDQWSSTPPPCAWAPRRPNRCCGASPAAGPSTPPTRPSKNSAARYAPPSRATTSPARTCAARSTAASRSWRTGTRRPPCSTTARTAR